jgi:hypothetical protein
LTISLAGFVFLSMTIYSIIITRLKSAEESAEDEQNLDYNEKLANADVSTLNRSQRRARARHLMKQRRRVTPANPAENEDRRARPEEQLLLAEEEENMVDPSIRHLSRKERQKSAKVAEKEERHLFEEDRRLQQRAAQEEAQRQKKDRERLQAGRAEEERKLRQEQKEAQEIADFEEWKTLLASPDRSKKLSVHDWIESLKKKRVVHVDDLASEFHMTSVKVTQRIQLLLDSARVAGVLESDGRFIYFSQDEMSSVSEFIQHQEKVSPQEVSSYCEELIRL